MSEIINLVGSVLFLLGVTAFSIYWIWLHIVGGSITYETEGLIPKLKRYRRDVKNCILWVTTKDEDGGYSSRWYGWSKNLKLSYDEALKEKERLQDKFYDIEIVEI